MWDICSSFSIAFSEVITISLFLKGVSVDVITVYGLHFSSGEGIALSLDSGLQNISLEGVCFLVVTNAIPFFFCSQLC